MQTKLSSSLCPQNAFLPIFQTCLSGRLGKTAFLASCTLILLSVPSLGQSTSWSGGTSSTWSTGTNWSSGVPTSTTDAIFNTSLNQNETITLVNGETAQGLIINNTGTTTLSGGSLELGADGISFNSGAGTLKVTSSLLLDASQTWNNASSSAATFSGSFAADSNATGPVTVTINTTGTGTWDVTGAFVDNSSTNTVSVTLNAAGGGITLEGASTNTGGDTVQSGTITIKNASALGLGTLTFGTGSTATNRINPNFSGNYVNPNSNMVLLPNDTTTLSANSGQVVTFNSAISGSGALVVNNLASSGSVLVLGGNNSFSGGTTFEGVGTFDINSSSALGTGTFNFNASSTLDNTSGAALTLSTNNPITFANNLSAIFGTASSTANNSINFGTGAVSLSKVTFAFAGTGETITFGGIATNTSSTATSFTVNSTSSGNLLSLGGFVLGSTNTAAISETFGGSGNIAVTGPVTNGTAFNNGLVYSGTGTLTLTGNNTYTGQTKVSNGTLQLGNGVATGGLSSGASTGGIAVTGGSLLFANSSSTTVGSSSITTNLGGGTIGFSTATASGSSVSLGALTLTAGTTSILSFSGANQTLTFNKLTISNTATTILNIYNYTAGDALFFTTTTSPSTATLDDITFYSDAGVTSLGNAVEFGTVGQVVPSSAVPEPSSFIAGGALLIMLLFKNGWNLFGRQNGSVIA